MEKNLVSELVEATNWTVFIHKTATKDEIFSAFAGSLHLAQDFKVPSNFDTMIFSIQNNEDLKF